jgi:hypothetical protein
VAQLANINTSNTKRERVVFFIFVTILCLKLSIVRNAGIVFKHRQFLNKHHLLSLIITLSLARGCSSCTIIVLLLLRYGRSSTTIQEVITHVHKSKNISTSFFIKP